MIEIRALTKKYEGNTVLKDVNLTIPEGCIYGIIGQSGAGKSTLLRCINGLEQYDIGSVTVNGIELGTLKGRELPELRRSIGMIFQNFALLNRKSVLENVKLPMKCWKYNQRQMEDRAIELLKRVGLEEKIYVMPEELSGGQKQRVAIARALALEPNILLCDEATSALDPAITGSILDLLADINRELGITIVIVTHEMSVIKKVCDKVAILENGNIVSQGTVEEVFLRDDSSLQRLMGDKKINAPEGKELVKVTLRGDEKDQQAIYNLAKSCNIPFGVFSADISSFHNKNNMGHIYLLTDEGSGDIIAAVLRKEEITAEAGKEF